jgi:hypothetical protein
LTVVGARDPIVEPFARKIPVSSTGLKIQTRNRVHFTRKALAYTLERAGFEAVEFGTSTTSVSLPVSIQYALFGRCLFPGGLCTGSPQRPASIDSRARSGPDSLGRSILELFARKTAVSPQNAGSSRDSGAAERDARRGAGDRA